MKFTYHLSDKYRDQVWVETGKRPAQGAELSIPDEEIPAAIRKALLGLPKRFGAVEIGSLKGGNGIFGFDVSVEPLVADGPISAEDAYKVILAMAEAYPALRAEVDARKKAHEEKQIAEKKQREESARQERERREREAAERAVRRAEWAREHGSPRLKKCFEEGYDCSRLYEMERAALEYPGFVLDYNDTSGWQERSGPTERAFAELDKARQMARPGAEVKIVWLTDQASNDPEHSAFDDGFEPCEAIVIRDDHYSEWLVQVVGG